MADYIINHLKNLFKGRIEGFARNSLMSTVASFNAAVIADNGFFNFGAHFPA
jgi:hypothetical protein